MPAMFVVYLALIVFLGWCALAMLGWLFHPMLKPTLTVFDKLAFAVAGALARVEGGIRDLETNVRGIFANSARWFFFGSNESEDAVPNWPWRRIARPLIALLTCAYLAVIELDLAALAFQVKLGTDPVPDLHLPLSLLMGLMWPVVAIAWGEALVEALDPRPQHVYAWLPRKVRLACAGVIGVGLLAALAGNIAFFVWRGGQLEAVNAYAGLGPWIDGLLGGLLFGSLVLAGLSGIPFLAVVVPIAFAIVCGVLLLLEGAAWGARTAIEAAEWLAEFVLHALLGFGTQLTNAVGAAVSALREWSARASERRNVKEASKPPPPPPPPAPPPVPPPTEPGFGHFAGRAVLEATRSFWSLVRDLTFGVGRAIVVIARATVAVLRPVVLFAAAVALWCFYLVPRFRYSFVNWLCRFPFVTERLHFQPFDDDPPPKGRLDTHLERLGLSSVGPTADVRALRGDPGPAVARGLEHVVTSSESQPPAAASGG